MADNHRRLMDDELKHKIESLIEQEQDGRERIKLIILSRVVNLIGDNINMLSSTNKEMCLHREEFSNHLLVDHSAISKHIAEDKAIIRGGKYATKIAVVLLAVINGLLGLLYYDMVDKVKTLVAESREAAQEIAALKVIGADKKTHKRPEE